MKSKTSLGFHLSVLLSSCILNERNDQDVDYTEGAYSDSAYEEKNNDTAKKEETSDYGGYHDSRYRGSLDGEPEAAAGADPKENAEKQPERSYNRKFLLF